MTLSTTTRLKNLIGNGVLVGFSFNFKTLDTSHIVVSLDDVVQGSGFSVVLNGDQDTSPGGTVTFSAAPGNGVIVTTERVIPLTQQTDYTAYDSFPAETHETALDKITMQTQENSEKIGRSVTAPGSDDGTTDFTLPIYVAGKGIIWDETTKKLKNSDDDINDITSAASASAASALVSENNAATSETNAGLSEGNALTYMNEANVSESNASTSEIAAAGHALSANTAEAGAVAAYDSFDDRYLGAKTSNPALDNDGDALLTGALYWHSTNKVFRVYDGTVWQDAFPGIGSVVAGYDLSTNIYTLNTAAKIAIVTQADLVVDVVKSFGPTGSGADVIVPAMDVIPLSANFIDVRIHMWVNGLTLGTQYVNALFGSKGTLTPTTGDQFQLAYLMVQNSSGNSQITRRSFDATIGLDSNNIFKLLRFNTGSGTVYDFDIGMFRFGN